MLEAKLLQNQKFIKKIPKKIQSKPARNDGQMNTKSLQQERGFQFSIIISPFP